MENMSDWIAIYYGSSQMVMAYWTVYVAVIAAIIGYVVQRGLRERRERVLFIVTFVLFSLANAIPMYHVQVSSKSAANQLASGVLSNAQLYATDPWVVMVSHGIFDVCILVFLLMWRESPT